MSLINILWGLVIITILAFGLYILFNAKGKNEKDKFYDSLLGIGIAAILVLAAFVTASTGFPW